MSINAIGFNFLVCHKVIKTTKIKLHKITSMLKLPVCYNYSTSAFMLQHHALLKIINELFTLIYLFIYFHVFSFLLIDFSFLLILVFFLSFFPFLFEGYRQIGPLREREREGGQRREEKLK